MSICFYMGLLLRKWIAVCLGLAVFGPGAFGGDREGKEASAVVNEVWNRGWEFRLEDGPSNRTWQWVHLPHTMSLPYFMSNAFYTGRGTYRKTLEVPDCWRGRKVFLDFGAAFQVAHVRVNGHEAAKHAGGYTAFRADLTPFLVPGANGVEVTVDNRWNPRLAPRAGEHTFSGGLYRRVFLHVCAPVYIPAHGVRVETPEVNPRRARVVLTTTVRNDAAVRRECMVRHAVSSNEGGPVVARGGKKVSLAPGEIAEVRLELPPVHLPRLWSPETPNLYNVETALVDARGAVLDKATNPLGFRTLELTADRGFLINGKPVYLRGANVHQDHAGWGDGVTDAGARRDVGLMKEAGFNCIRGSHYPHSQAFVGACDQLGMCLLCEGGVWGMGGFREHDTYWNCDSYPSHGEERAAFEESCLQQVREMVLQGRNHPSIVAWSVGNEAFFTAHAPEVRALCGKLIAVVKELDPTRPVCVGGGQRAGFDALGDWAAYNGDGARVKTPGRPSMVTEYGSVSCRRPGAYAPGWGDLADDKRENKRYPWRVGEAVWCGFDHGSIWPSGARMGLVDYFRIPKRAWYWYRNEYRHIPPPAWPRPGAPARLSLVADKTTIDPADGTDDVHLVVRVTDAKGTPLANEMAVTLSVLSGPGEFPTGKSITFVPGTDIDMIDGCAAIEFRSYYAGKTIIEASSPGLEGASICLVSHHAPPFLEGVSPETRERPYRRFSEKDREAQRASRDSRTAGPERANLAAMRPCIASSQACAAMMAADGDPASAWRPAVEDSSPWWRLDLEFEFAVTEVRVLPAGEWKERQLRVEFSRDGAHWMALEAQMKEADGDARTCNLSCPAGTRARYVRIQAAPGQGLAEVVVLPAP